MITAGLWLCATTVQSDEKPAQGEPVKQYKALIDQFEEDGDARESAGLFIALAEQHSKSPVAVDALVWVVTNVRRGKDLDRATRLLARNHPQNEKLEPICQKLSYRLSLASEGLLRALRDKSPHRVVRAQASFYLAGYLQGQLGLIAVLKKEDANRQQFEQFYGNEFTEHLARVNTSASLKEIESIYEDVVKSFANVRLRESTMGETARRQLYAIRNLSVGRTAPEIAGEDIDGKAFKLSDYRGKVVLLDFWGHW